MPQIVEEEIFNAVKEKMRRRKFETTRKRTSQILTGLLVCGNCGSPYVIGNYYRGKYPYYRCSTKMRKGKSVCDNRNLRGDEIDNVILKEVKEIIFSKENLGKYRKLIDESIKDEKKELQELLKKLMKKQEELDKKKSVYYEGLETGKLDMSLVADRLKQIKTEEERITSNRLEAEQRLLEIPQTEHYALTEKEYHDLKESLQAFVEEATPQQKHLFLSKFIDTITVYPDKMTIEYFSPMLTDQKSPYHKGKSFLVTGLASPIPQ